MKFNSDCNIRLSSPKSRNGNAACYRRAYTELEITTEKKRVSKGPLVVKNLPASAGDARDVGSIPGLGRSPGEGNGNLLQHSCLGNPTTEKPGGLQPMGW